MSWSGEHRKSSHSCGNWSLYSRNQQGLESGQVQEGLQSKSEMKIKYKSVTAALADKWESSFPFPNLMFKGPPWILFCFHPGIATVPPLKGSPLLYPRVLQSRHISHLLFQELNLQLFLRPVQAHTGILQEWGESFSISSALALQGRGWSTSAVLQLCKSVDNNGHGLGFLLSESCTGKPWKNPYLLSSFGEQGLSCSFWRSKMSPEKAFVL